MRLDAAELVLYKSITVHSQEEHGHSTVAKIDYSYEFIEDFQDPREEWYFRLTSLFTRKDHTLGARNNTMDMENNTVTLTALRMSSRLNSTAGYVSPSTHTHHTLKHRNNKWGPKKFEKQNHVLKLMV